MTIDALTLFGSRRGLRVDVFDAIMQYRVVNDLIDWVYWVSGGCDFIEDPTVADKFLLLVAILVNLLGMGSLGDGKRMTATFDVRTLVVGKFDFSLD